METLIHADVFFFISTIWLVVLSAILAIILIYIALILNDLKHISRKIREGGEALSDDINEWRTSIKSEGLRFKHIFKYFKKLFTKRAGHKK